MFEVTEKEATGEVAEIYQDIRETMDMPFVNTIWRNFATKEGVLQWVWYSLNQSMSPGRLRIMHRSFEFVGRFKCFTYSCFGT